MMRRHTCGEAAALSFNNSHPFQHALTFHILRHWKAFQSILIEPIHIHGQIEHGY